MGPPCEMVTSSKPQESRYLAGVAPYPLGVVQSEIFCSATCIFLQPPQLPAQPQDASESRVFSAKDV
jgi:hypothetical protein